MTKIIKSEFLINELSQKRWSPRAFSSKAIEKNKVQSVLEAARWSASAFNEQPWRFLIAFQGDDNFKKISETLVEFNQQWATKAPLLILNCYQIKFTANGKPNLTAQYDLGQAVAHYSLEAIHQGLYVHQMTGFDAQNANEALDLGEEITAFSVTAMGYLGDKNNLPREMQKMEESEPNRMLQKDFILNDF